MAFSFFLPENWVKRNKTRRDGLLGKNRGAFSRAGKPSQADYDALLEEKRRDAGIIGHTPSFEELAEMSRVDVAKVDPAILPDIGSIQVDPHLPYGEWMAEFVRQAGNPFLVSTGQMVAKIAVPL